MEDHMQPDLSNLNDRIKEERDLIDRITPQVPFYEDYVKEKEQYAADRIVRDQLSSQLDTYRQDISRFSSDQYKAGNSDILPALEDLMNLLQKMVNNTKHADFGSADLSKVKFSEEDKMMLLEYDWRMISHSEELKSEVDALLGAEGDSLQEKSLSLKKVLRDFEKTFEARKNVLMEAV
jgi:hypothetical protein